MAPEDIGDDELALLLNEIVERYGYDFTSYSTASVKRRISRLFILDHFKSFEEFRKTVLTEKNYIRRFVQEITVNVTEMFRDPGFYKLLRTQVLPVLATYPFVRIWHAGCSTGEEVYSMAIMLKEVGIMEKSLMYATDINPDVLDQVMKGIYPLRSLKLFSENYILSGGKEDFSSYYTAKYDLAKFDDELRSKMIVSTHNLVSDRSFNEFQLIICRNVLIYFNKPLQDKVLELFDASLEPRGYLALGSKEQIKFASISSRYEQLDPKEKIWRKLQ
ncbi:MAG: protein-glutamate O-methyltransferase CheR [Chitinophagaceae bacterium]|nr:protein-glutamate O-methyltransferase CheR [Chitinophagaceae bacterium]